MVEENYYHIILICLSVVFHAVVSTDETTAAGKAFYRA